MARGFKSSGEWKSDRKTDKQKQDNEEPVLLYGFRLKQTKGALRFSETGKEKQAVWLPLSFVTFTHDDKWELIIEIPAWLAKREGLI